MLVNLPNGKTIELPFEQFWKLSLDDINFLMSNGFGADIEDPFTGSHLFDKSKLVDNDEEEEEEEDEMDEELLKRDDE